MNKEDLFKWAEGLALESQGRIRLAHNEEDTTSDIQLEAAHFLKLDECRLGRDLELYNFMSKIMRWEGVLVHILEEVLFPAQALIECPQSSLWLMNLGLGVYELGLQDDWRGLFR